MLYAGNKPLSNPTSNLLHSNQIVTMRKDTVTIPEVWRYKQTKIPIVLKPTNWSVSHVLESRLENKMNSKKTLLSCFSLTFSIKLLLNQKKNNFCNGKKYSLFFQ